MVRELHPIVTAIAPLINHRLCCVFRKSILLSLMKTGLSNSLHPLTGSCTADSTLRSSILSTHKRAAGQVPSVKSLTLSWHFPFWTSSAALYSYFVPTLSSITISKCFLRVFFSKRSLLSIISSDLSSWHKLNGVYSLISLVLSSGAHSLKTMTLGDSEVFQ